MAVLAAFSWRTPAAELPVLRGPAEPQKFIHAVGRRALLMGREDAPSKPG